MRKGSRFTGEGRTTANECVDQVGANIAWILRALWSVKNLNQEAILQNLSTRIDEEERQLGKEEKRNSEITDL